MIKFFDQEHHLIEQYNDGLSNIDEPSLLHLSFYKKKKEDVSLPFFYSLEEGEEKDYSSLIHLVVNIKKFGSLSIFIERSDVDSEKIYDFIDNIKKLKKIPSSSKEDIIKKTKSLLDLVNNNEELPILFHSFILKNDEYNDLLSLFVEFSFNKPFLIINFKDEENSKYFIKNKKKVDEVPPSIKVDIKNKLMNYVFAILFSIFLLVAAYLALIFFNNDKKVEAIFMIVLASIFLIAQIINYINYLSNKRMASHFLHHPSYWIMHIAILIISSLIGLIGAYILYKVGFKDVVIPSSLLILILLGVGYLVIVTSIIFMTSLIMSKAKK